MKMGKKCSHCGNIGHNSRTCTNYKATSTFVSSTTSGLRLFGVQLVLDINSSSSSSSCSSNSSISNSKIDEIMMMKKSLSMDCLSSHSISPSPPSSILSINESSSDKTSNLCSLSDGLLAPLQERKKGVGWTKEEHRRFLEGLEKLGKGDWRGISKHFVSTRNPTQVASHAQKYFLRNSSSNTLPNMHKKRRSSLFDMVRVTHSSLGPIKLTIVLVGNQVKDQLHLNIIN
ncbi:hypothetical protein LguiA_020107 [Lonicera macranthoides]